MKKFTSLLLITLFLVISGCSKDDGNDPIIQDNTEEKLLGRWIVDEYDLNGSTQIVLQDSGETETFIGCDKDLAYDLVFSNNPNSFTSNGSYKLNLDTTSESGTINQLFLFTVDESGSWELSNDGGKILINNGDETYALSIIELTTDLLVVIRNLSSTEVDGTTTTSTSAVETIRFIKI